MVREVRIGNRTLPVHFGMGALLKFARSEGKTFEEVFQNLGDVLDSIESKVNLAVVGINEGFRKSGSDERIDSEELLDLLDENPVLLEEVFLIFNDQTLERVAKQNAALGNLQERTAALLEKQKALLGTESSK